MDKPLTYM